MSFSGACEFCEFCDGVCISTGSPFPSIFEEDSDLDNDSDNGSFCIESGVIPLFEVMEPDLSIVGILSNLATRLYPPFTQDTYCIPSI